MRDKNLSQARIYAKEKEVKLGVFAAWLAFGN
jgi:hypothetical protein